MNTKVLLTAAAVVLGACGVAGSFLPQEFVSSLGLGNDPALPLLIQLLAAALFAFAMVNWTARGSLIGGIYNRPVAIGNLTHFVIGGLALVKVVIDGERRLVWVVAALVYMAFAAAFTIVLFKSPVQPSSSGIPTTEP